MTITIILDHYITIPTNTKIYAINILNNSIYFGGSSNTLYKINIQELVKTLNKDSSIVLADTTEIPQLDNKLDNKSIELLEAKADIKNIHISEICNFGKSVSSIACDTQNNLIAVSSFDSTCKIIKDDEMVELIEGPETEIKRVAFSKVKNFLAISTRGKTVWICKKMGEESNIHINNENTNRLSDDNDNNKDNDNNTDNTYNSIDNLDNNKSKNLTNNEISYEIESILEDHVQDVKGVIFNDSKLYSYGYDCTIKIYDELKSYDESFSLMDSLTLESTIWDIVFFEKYYMAVSEDGFIYKICTEYNNILESKKMSEFPIYRAIRINNRFLAFIHDINNICVCGENFEIIKILECAGWGINCLEYDIENKLMYIGDDKPELKIYRLSINE